MSQRAFHNLYFYATRSFFISLAEKGGSVINRIMNMIRFIAGIHLWTVSTLLVIQETTENYVKAECPNRKL